MDAYPDDLLHDLYASEARLQDVTAMKYNGIRLPGGMSARVEFAHLQRLRAQDAIFELVASNPEAAHSLLDDIRYSQVPTNSATARRLKQRLDASHPPAPRT